VALRHNAVVPGHGTSLSPELRDTTPVQPETRYAKSGNVNIAYQVVGDDPPDLVAVDVISHIELDKEIPSKARFFTRLASICRLFRVNQRGTGMSDRDVGVPTLETRMDDIRAVLDAVGSERAVLFGLGDASPLSVLFAATYPERTAGLILMNASPRFVKSPSLPWLPTREETQRQADDFERRWGDPAFAYEVIGMLNPSAPEEELQSIARAFRLSVSPGAAAAYIRMNIDVDVCDVLPLLRVPTLVMHRKDGKGWDIRSGRYLAEHIPGARFVELPGADFSPSLGEQEPVFAELESFLGDVVAGTHPRLNPTGCWPRSSSRTSSAPARGRQRSATGPGENSCCATTNWSAASWFAFAARRWTRLATASSPPSTARPGPSAAGVPLPRPCRSWDSRCGSVCTLASASSLTARWPASLCIRGPESPPMRSRAKCSSRRPSETWSRARG
jgi:pimeloyl-ACP methyl ester carboxylesterase